MAVGKDVAIGEGVLVEVGSGVGTAVGAAAGVFVGGAAAISGAGAEGTADSVTVSSSPHETAASNETASSPESADLFPMESNNILTCFSMAAVLRLPGPETDDIMARARRNTRAATNESSSTGSANARVPTANIHYNSPRFQSYFEVHE